MTTKSPRTFDSTGKPEKAAPVNLSSLEKVRFEMSRVYRDARAGAIEAGDATKLVFMLGEIVKVFKAENEAAKVEAAAPPAPPSLDVSKLSIETQREIARARRGSFPVSGEQ